MRSLEAPTEADLLHHHDVALAPNLEAGGLQPDPHCDSNSSHLSGWYLSLEITDKYLLGFDIFHKSATVKKYTVHKEPYARAPSKPGLECKMTEFSEKTSLKTKMWSSKNG